MFSYATFQIHPGQGLGPIRLFDSLYRVVNLLRAQGVDDLRFVYSKKSHYITVQMAKFNINLVFDRNRQRLLFIELNPSASSTYKLQYKGECEANWSFKDIYNRLFGPTYPGYVDKNALEYYLSYSGVVFKFAGLDCLEKAMEKLDGNDDDGSLVQILNNSPQEFDCSSIVIFKGSSWKKSAAAIAEYNKSTSDIGMARLEDPNCKRHETAVRGDNVSVQHASVNLEASNVMFEFAEHPSLKTFVLKIGQDYQQVVCALGPPEASVVRSSREGPVKIHNYFSLGLDIVYIYSSHSGSGAKVARIVLHHNVVNSLEFMHYELVNAIFQCASQKTCSGTCTFDAIKKWAPSKGPDIFLDRKSYEFNSRGAFEMVDLEGEVQEVNEQAKEWGRSKLSNVKNAIFEYLVDGSQWTSVTLY